MGSAGEELRLLDLTRTRIALSETDRRLHNRGSLDIGVGERVAEGFISERILRILSTKYDEKSSLVSAALG